jgi:putative nucleotidyltransferase with HDIG domain
MDQNIQSLIEGINKNPDFVFIRNLLRRLPKARVYLVGGAVRDALQGKESEDFDFVVTGCFRRDLEKFLAKFGKVSDVDSRTFGVFKFRPHGYQGREDIDIALPRKERQTGPGYKDFKIETSSDLKIEDDLARRDFTVNAIALKIENLKFKIKNYELIDPFSGVNDLKKKIIRAVGNPEERFLEDPSRILRCFRLACQMNFKIEEKTLKAAEKLVPEIKKTFIDNSGRERTRVANEIIAEEFLKGFDGAPVRLIGLYDKAGILDLILPELLTLKGVAQPRQFHSEGDVWEHTILTLRNLKSEADINVKLAGLFHDIGKPDTQTMPKDKTDRIRFNEHDERGTEIFEKICKRLKLSSPFSKKNPLYINKKEVSWLIKNHMICVGKNPEKMRPGTIEKYFFKNRIWGKHLLELSKADISATILSSGESDFSRFNILKKKTKEVGEILKREAQAKKLERKLPQILDGHEIQRVFQIKKGPLVGRVKDLIRYLQLKEELETRKDILKIKKQILKTCQRTKTTEEAEDYFKNF